jgi:general secretion pathway protein G
VDLKEKLMRARIRKAFTLVEILIVVVILGILAAIVVPQFTNATQDAQVGNLKAQLDTLNNQMELFKARTNNYPDFATAQWDTMINNDPAIPNSGGYIKAPPVNPINSQSTVAAAAAGDGTVGWYFEDDANGVRTLYADEYDATTGKATPGVPGVH